MEYVFPSSNNDPLSRICSPNKGSEHFATSRQEELPFFKHFPSPFLDDISTTQLAPPQHNHLMAFPYPNKALNIDTELSSSSTTPDMTLKKKKRRSGKKDRHSKIRTVHGLRDRRMRLSREISRQFFDLQDMLGFDKASKTIDWLFSKSMKAIKEVTQMKNNQGICIGKRGESPLSKCELGLEITAKSKTRRELGASKSENLQSRKSRKLTLDCNDPVARESREKARARARARTREKMLIKCLEDKSGKCEWFEANPKSNLGKLGLGFSKNPNRDKLGSSSQDRNFSLEDQFANVEIIEKLLGPSRSAFGYQKSFSATGSLDSGSKFLEFLEIRDAENLRIYLNTNVDPFTATIQRENPSYTPMTSFNMNFHSQHLGERSVQFP